MLLLEELHVQYSLYRSRPHPAERDISVRSATSGAGLPLEDRLQRLTRGSNRAGLVSLQVVGMLMITPSMPASSTLVLICSATCSALPATAAV